MVVRKYLIIDENKTYVMDLNLKLCSYPLLELVAVCSTLEEGIAVLASQAVDLIFLDFTLASTSTIRLLQFGLNLPRIILTSTSSQDFSVSFRFGIKVGFLIKPFDSQELFSTLNQLFNLQVTANSFANHKSIFLKTGRRIQHFTFHEIQYIESFGVYSKIHTNETVHIVNERLHTLVMLLPSRYFIRVHKSYIIHLGNFTSYDKAHFYINQVKIPIGVSFRSKLAGLLNLL